MLTEKSKLMPRLGVAIDLQGVMVLFLAGWPALGAACTERQASYQQAARDSRDAKPPSTVIWCFVGSRDTADSLAVALDSHLITHAAIFAGNRYTSDTLGRQETKDAINIAHDKGIPLILVRYLWRTQPAPGFGKNTLADVNYYIDEIEKLRNEARKIGAAFIGLDTEAYGPTGITDFFRSKNFSENDYTKLSTTVQDVVRDVGQVDYVLPAGSARRYHPYIALAKLGKLRIAEGTYHDRKDEEEKTGRKNTEGLKYAYEIAGMYVNVTKINERHPHLKYFLPEDVFETRREVWEASDAVMIWPRENAALDVARKLRDYAKNSAYNEREKARTRWSPP